MTYDYDGNDYYACQKCGLSVYGDTIAELVADAIKHECRRQDLKPEDRPERRNSIGMLY